MRILLGSTGSVAATLTPRLIAELSARGHTVEVVATESSRYFFDPAALGVRVWQDSDEWPKSAENLPVPRSTPLPPHEDACSLVAEGRAKPFHPSAPRSLRSGIPTNAYARDQEIPHIALGKWADALLIAPCSANTLAKIANGMCDNLLTGVARAWDRTKPIILAPAMNTRMWEHPATAEHLATLRRWYPHCTIIEPVAKRLACGDTGIGALAPIATIVGAIALEEK